MALIRAELLPVLHVLAHVDLLGQPDHRLLLLASEPEIVVLDGEENKAILGVREKRLGLQGLRGGLKGQGGRLMHRALTGTYNRRLFSL